MRFRLFASVLLLSTACAPSGEVLLDVGPLRDSAALSGVPLDRLTVRVSGPDFGEIETDVGPGQDEVSLDVPPGPERRFELEGVRITSDGIEIVAYAGETVQSITAGVNRVTLPYRTQGAIEVVPAVVGDDLLPEGGFLVLIDEAERTTKVSFDSLTNLRVGRYRVAGSGLGALRPPSSTEIDVVEGEFTPVMLPLFRSATQCLPDAPPEVREDGQGCATVPVELSGLALPEVEVLVNGVPVRLASNDNFFLDSGVAVGEPYTITVRSPFGDVRQRCEVENGAGIGGDEGTVRISCGPVEYRLDLEVFGELGDGITIGVARSESDGEPDFERTVTAQGLTETDLFFEPVTSFGALDVFVVEEQTTAGTRCTVADPFEVAGDRIPPLRVICVGSPEPVYPGRDGIGDYVRLTDGSTCPTTELGFDRCIDASSLWRIFVPGLTSCDGVDLLDHGDLFSDARVFAWTCRSGADGIEWLSVGFEALERVSIDTVSGQVRVTPAIIDAATERTLATSPDIVFSNPVESANSLATPLNVQGTVYFTDFGAIAGQRSIDAPRVTLIALAELSASSFNTVSINAAFATVAGRFANFGTSGSNVISVQPQGLFANVMGAYRSTDAFGICIDVAGDNSRIQSVDLTGCGTGIRLGGQYIQTHDARLERLFNVGISLQAPHQRIFDSSIDRVSGDGIRLGGDSISDTWIDQLRISETSGRGLEAFAHLGLHVSNTLVVGAENGAIAVDGSGNLMRGITYANGGIFNNNPNGLTVGGRHAVIERVIGAGLGDSVVLSNADDVVLRDSVLSDARGAELSSRNSNNVTVDGQLVLERGACAVSGGTSVGLTSATCTQPDGTLPPPSTAVVTIRSTGLAGAFTGASSDAVNETNFFDNANVSIVFPTRTGEPVDMLNVPVDDRDWSRFETRSRAWLGDGLGGLSCLESASCEVYDFSLAPGSPAVGLVPSPTSLPVVRMRWGSPTLLGAPTSDSGCQQLYSTSRYDSSADTCFNDFLAGADEMVGNGNGLCESDETCLYRPEAGAFSAGGPPFTEQTVSAGAVTNVTLRIPTLP